MLIALILMPRTKVVAEFNEGCWCLKMLFVLGVFLVSFWIPNDPFFETFYLNMACIVSFFYLVF